MATTKQVPARHVRRSLTLPREIANRVDAMAKRRRLSENRVLVELIEQGMEARKQKESAFFDLAERFRSASDPERVKALGEQLGRFVFGE
jgi:predicted DNA-binding protein